MWLQVGAGFPATLAWLLLLRRTQRNLEQKTEGGTDECAGEAAFLISCDWEACPAQVASFETLNRYIQQTVGLLP